MDSVSPRHTCLKLEIPRNSPPRQTERIFVKGTWFSSRFDLLITDGLQAWTCHASDEEVEERASQWDQPISKYIDLAEKYLGFQQPGSDYGFADAGTGHQRLSWTFEREGTKLEWRWKCQQSPNSKETTANILDFLMDANIRLSEEVVCKTQSFERLRVEADKCLAQSENLSKEREEFESALYAKFLRVLNSKKKKLRELRDKISKQGNAVQEPVEGETESTDRTEIFDEESNEEKSGNEVEKTDVGTSSEKKNDVGVSKDVPARRCRGRKRK